MISLDVNGKTQELDADPATPLLYVLRDHLQLNGAKFGCGLGQCGACTVLVDGRAVFSCVTPISTLAGRRITTLEGLGTPEKPGRVQRAVLLVVSAYIAQDPASLLQLSELTAGGPRRADRVS